MQFYFREPKPHLTECYKVLREQEFKVIKDHLFKQFPVRFQNKDFCLLTNLGYAEKIAEEKNNWAPFDGAKLYVAKFLVKASFLKNYTMRYQSFFLPKRDLEELNQNIVGFIEIIKTVELVFPISRNQDEKKSLIEPYSEAKTNDIASLYRDRNFGQIPKLNVFN